MSSFRSYVEGSHGKFYIMPFCCSSLFLTKNVSVAHNGTVFCVLQVTLVWKIVKQPLFLSLYPIWTLNIKFFGTDSAFALANNVLCLPTH